MSNLEKPIDTLDKIVFLSLTFLCMIAIGASVYGIDYLVQIQLTKEFTIDNFHFLFILMSVSFIASLYLLLTIIFDFKERKDKSHKLGSVVEK